MDEESETLHDCKLEKNGDVNCKISKEAFINVQDEGIKPNKLVLEIED